MATTKRCPKCGASNPETAEWCSLCLERFEVLERETTPDLEIDDWVAPGGAAAPGTDGDGAVPSPAGAEGSGHARVATTTAGSKVETSGFEVTEEGVRWICIRCGTTNGLDATECAACGMSFAEVLRPKAERPEGDPGKAALFSLFFPGAGHAYLGMWGQAVARAVLSLWVLLVTLIGLVDSDIPGSMAMGVMFGIASLALWATSSHDAFREGSDEPEKVLLKGRRFLFVVLGLMALLFVVMLTGLMSGQLEGEALSIPAWRSTSSQIFTELPTS